MKAICVHIPEGHLQKIDDLVREGFFPNRAEAIRLAIRDLILEHEQLIHKP